MSEPQNYEEFKTLVAKQRKVLDKRQKSFDVEKLKLAEILKNCPHTEVVQRSEYYSSSYYDPICTEVVQRSEYYSSSYYDPICTDYWMQCTLCGECGPVTTETGYF